MIHFPRVLISGATILAACAPASSSDLLLLEIDDATVQVDSLCTTDACAAPSFEATLTYQYVTGMTRDTTAEILQYRVDYELPDLAGETCPFFAAQTDLLLALDEPTTLPFLAAGSEQRAWAFTRTDGVRTTGTATLTVAGYGMDHLVLQATADFPIAFENLAETETSDTGLEDSP